MSSDSEIGRLFQELMLTANPSRQTELLNALRTMPGINFNEVVSVAMRTNPFLGLSREAYIGNSYSKALNELFMIKQLAHATQGLRICVFCMPKSGSSFTQSAIEATLSIPLVSLISHAGNPSALGINGREQELDELAILSAILASGGSFIAQHHTLCTPYLCHQLRFYGIRPVITVRNVFDAIVSADDMFLTWRKTCDWMSDPMITLPVNYQSKSIEERLSILARTFGFWLVRFYLSWKRCERERMVSPLWLYFEEDILNKTPFTGKIARFLNLNADQTQRLAGYVNNPDKSRSRINKGVSGRGAVVPPAAKQELVDYAMLFADEFSPQDMKALFG